MFIFISRVKIPGSSPRMTIRKSTLEYWIVDIVSLYKVDMLDSALKSKEDFYKYNL